MMSDKPNPSPALSAPLSAERNVGADIVRILACFLVMSIHFLLHIGFYKYYILGVNMHIMLVMRMFFSICVPLFILLTGYLMVNKPLSARHYAKGMRVVWIYLLACAACIAYQIIFRGMGTWDSHFWDILNFKAAPYSWYIEMYLGLYLMIPFLNILYRHLPNKKWKLALVLTFVALNSLPKLLNSFHFLTPDWWTNPLVTDQYQKLVPGWWYYNTYPLTYYFIGAYLREYGLRLNGVVHRVLILFTLGLSTLFELWRSGGQTFSWGVGSEWDFLLTLILAVLVFSLLVQKDYSRLPGKLKGFLKYLSGLTLSMFLVSYIFDEEFYKILNELIPSAPNRLPAYFVIVPAVFLASMALAAALDLIYRLLRLIGEDIKSRVRLSRKTAVSEDAAESLPDADKDIANDLQPIPDIEICRISTIQTEE